jgi:hypothetical protein
VQSITLELTVEEAKVLLQISNNQLFRLKFLDPKMPGYKARPGELEAAERAVKTLETALKSPKTTDEGGWTTPISRRDGNHRVR